MTVIINLSYSSLICYTRLFKLADGDMQAQMEDTIEIQPSKATVSPSNVQYPNNPAIPNQLKLTTNFNFHIDDQGQFGGVDVSKGLSYQSHELTNNVLTKNVLLMKKGPINMTSSNVEQHFVDCNNNLNPPIPEQHIAPPPIYQQKLLATHHLSPLNIKTQFHLPQFVNHINWNRPQFQ